LIEVGARGHIVKSVKNRLRALFRAWLPAGHRSGIGQMIKDVSRISLACSFAIFQAHNNPVWFSPCCHMTYRRGANRRVSRETPGEATSPVLPTPKKDTKKGVGRCYLLFLDCVDTLPIAPVVLVLSCRCPWPCCRSTSSCCCRVCPPF
jgi:hypothetical protein